MANNLYGLQHYLTAVQQKEEAPKKKKVKTVASTVTSKKTKPSLEQPTPANNFGLPTYSDCLNLLKKQERLLTNIDEQTYQLLSHLLSYSKGDFVDYVAATTWLSRAMFMSKLDIEQILYDMAQKNIVILQYHQWKGLLIVCHPVYFSYKSEARATIEESNVFLEAEMLNERDIIPFEKQLIFIIHKLSQMNISLSGNVVLQKLKIDELRAICIQTNPMLVLLEQVTAEQTDEDMIQCEDKIVAFVLNIAYHCNWLVKQEGRLLFHISNWEKWLHLNTIEKQTLLKLVVSSVLQSHIDDPLRIFFLRQLYMVDTGWRKEQLDGQQLLAQFINALGWHDMLRLNNELLIKQKMIIEEKSKPYIMPHLQLYCMPDCLSLSIWNLLIMSNYQRGSEVLQLQVTEKSLHRAFRSGYSFTESASLLELEEASELYPFYERMVRLVLKEEASEMAGMQSEAQHINHQAIFSTMLSTLVQTNETAVLTIREKILIAQEHISQLPKLWFSDIRTYNQSTIIEIVQVALQFCLVLEIVVEENVICCLPLKLLLTQSQASLQGNVLSSPTSKPGSYEIEWPIKSITALRICR